ncbi:hypothetical protein [Lysinibacillus xylanilyticus]|uniref:hypothetical protein n=1 Tax=Lysinibacillus xylanilyticus TaxID=582475 RepID=UPI003D08A296
MGISDRGTKAKNITSCDNAFVTNIVLARDPGASIASEAAHRTPPGSSALCESEASATKRPVGTEINHTLWDKPNTDTSKKDALNKTSSLYFI